MFPMVKRFALSRCHQRADDGFSKPAGYLLDEAETNTSAGSAY
jgi:hypothetical protein